jgi:hypothetical protein
LWASMNWLIALFLFSFRYIGHRVWRSRSLNVLGTLSLLPNFFLWGLTIMWVVRSTGRF